jgi:hypothetical protein
MTMEATGNNEQPARRRRNVTHEWIDQRSLALSTEIAQMIRENPELLNRAKENLARWI